MTGPMADLWIILAVISSSEDSSSRNAVGMVVKEVHQPVVNLIRNVKLSQFMQCDNISYSLDSTLNVEFVVTLRWLGLGLERGLGLGRCWNSLQVVCQAWYAHAHVVHHYSLVNTLRPASFFFVSCTHFFLFLMYL